jgi:sec-independent protein translocase protein TatA
MIGKGEILIILIVVLILFGAKKIPEFAKGLGKGIKEFKKAVKDSSIDDVTSEIDTIMEKDKTDEQ